VSLAQMLIFGTCSSKPDFNFTKLKYELDFFYFSLVLLPDYG